MEENGVIRWERFLPRAFVRVLLVEKDDSTREIVAALLRKCGYRVVLAADGLKAWEMIKEKTQQIDLVLTEVELPHMSGFALLTFIMEHESCKSIPVIMMSSHDSMNMVFKCMLKGAADFLVKPIRKNELRNLWQHVWRRYISNGESGGSDASPGVNLAKQKCKDNLDNDAASNHSDENLACFERKGECSDKGSDTQNSCTRQGMEAESTCMQNMQKQNQMNLTSTSVNSAMRIHGIAECINLKKVVPIQDEAGGKSATLFPEVTSCNQAADAGVDYQDSIPPTGFNDNCDQSIWEKSTEIADLLGAMDNKAGCVPESDPITDDSIPKDSGILIEDNNQLELSLKRYQPQNCDGTETNGCNMLSHSSYSAFSRYNSRNVLPNFPPMNCRVGKEDVLGYHCQYQLNQDPPNPTCSQLSGTMESTVISSSSQDGKAVQCLQTDCTPFPVPAVPYSLFAGFGFSLQPIVSRELGPPPWSTKPTIQKAIPVNFPKQSGPKILDSIKSCDSHDQSGKIENCQAEHAHVGNFEFTEDLRNLSTVTDQSGSSSINGSNNVNSTGVGSVCNGYSDSMAAQNTIKATGESCNDERVLSQGGIKLTQSHRSIEREAALTKFRLKRKDRCFEKKVRYHSRQKLAEQRPRVKGQFVRQGQPDPKLIEVDSHQSKTMAT